MEYLVVLFIFALFRFGLVTDMVVGVTIEPCTRKSTDILAEAPATFTCKGFTEVDTVRWSVLITDMGVIVSTCSPSNCTSPSYSTFTVQRSPGQVQLVYYPMKWVTPGEYVSSVLCRVQQPDGSSRYTYCSVNRINPANLSSCVVLEDTAEGTVNGSCHFERAHPGHKSLKCMWYMNDSSTVTQVPGIIEKETYTSDGKQYERGRCSFLKKTQTGFSDENSYSIDFFPGPGILPVPVATLTEMTGTTDSASPTVQSASSTTDTVRDVTIEPCTRKSTDILADAPATFTCKGFTEVDTVRWSVMITDMGVIVSTCSPSNCTSPSYSTFTVQRSPEQVQLVYYPRKWVTPGEYVSSVLCRVQQPDGSSRYTYCSVNRINPANLSSCVVLEDTAEGTVNGSCHFERAHPGHKSLKCMWYMNDSSTVTQVPGVIEKETYTSDGKQYERGRCSFLKKIQTGFSEENSYSIDFFPGPGILPVPVVTLTEMTGTTDSASSTVQSASPATGGPDSPGSKDDPINIVAIAGWTVAAVLAVASVVTVAVILVRRNITKAS